MRVERNRNEMIEPKRRDREKKGEGETRTRQGGMRRRGDEDIAEEDRRRRKFKTRYGRKMS